LIPPTQRSAWARFRTLTVPIFRSEERWRVTSFLSAHVLLLFAISGLNVLNSYTGRDFMNALGNRDLGLFQTKALMYVGVFGLLTLAAVVNRYVEQRLGLLWRQWLTARLVARYLSSKHYHRLKHNENIDNPDQRLTDDINTFTQTTLSFVLILLNSVMTLIAFSGVLWSITPALFLVAVAYAVFGSVMTILIGRRLVGLNFLQLKKEADLRYRLIRIRENSEAIAFVHSERQENAGIRERLSALVKNFREIIRVNVNLGLFTNGYNYFTQIIPVLVVAPRFFNGEIEIGVVTQSVMAFASVLNAFSVIVTEFQRISSFGAVIARLGGVYEATQEDVPPGPEIISQRDGPCLKYNKLTLFTSKGEFVLVKDLDITLQCGERLLIMGPNGAGKSAIFRATAGIWENGTGTIERPNSEEVMFFPQEPYSVPGTLRDQLVFDPPMGHVTDDQIVAALKQVKLDRLIERVGSLHVERDWDNLLSTGERQLIAFARLLLGKPRFAFLDVAVNALDEHWINTLYGELARSTGTYVSIGDHPALKQYHHQLLELAGDGNWKLSRIPECRA
jgi:vitamin B12/bleomycin/antimicrobial peptide transport system ATP-binding/permease protein